MKNNLPIGTRVTLRETFHGVTEHRYGNVVEVSGERSRIAWDYSYQGQHETPNNVRPMKGKRTWIKSDRLMVVPVEIV